MYNKEVQGIVIWYVGWNQDKARDIASSLNRGNSHLSMNTIGMALWRKVCEMGEVIISGQLSMAKTS